MLKLASYPRGCGIQGKESAPGRGRITRRGSPTAGLHHQKAGCYKSGTGPTFSGEGMKKAPRTSSKGEGHLNTKWARINEYHGRRTGHSFEGKKTVEGLHACPPCKMTMNRLTLRVHRGTVMVHQKVGPGER